MKLNLSLLVYLIYYRVVQICILLCNINFYYSINVIKHIIFRFFHLEYMLTKFPFISKLNKKIYIIVKKVSQILDLFEII